MTWRRLALGGMGLLGGMLVLGVGLEIAGYTSPTDPPPAHVLSGTFTLVDDDTAANRCVGPDGGSWEEVRPGAEVAVSSAGHWLASAELGEGRRTTWGQFGDAACAYDFRVGVSTAEAYTIDYPGGLSVDYTHDELEGAGWQIASTCCAVVPAR